MSSAPTGGLIDVDRASPRTIRLVVWPGLAPGDMRPLADRLVRELRRAAVAEVLVDVSRVRSPDIGYVDALARLHEPADDRAPGRRVDRALHLHRFEHEQLLAALDLLPGLDGHRGDETRRGRADVPGLRRIRQLLRRPFRLLRPVAHRDLARLPDPLRARPRWQPPSEVRISEALAASRDRLASKAGAG